MLGAGNVLGGKVRLGQVMKYLAAILLCASLAGAQEPTRTQRRIDFALLAGVGAGRVADWHSTRYMLDRGNHELILGPIADTPQGLGAFEAAMWGTEVWFDRRMFRQHPKAVIAYHAIVLGSLVFCAVHNYKLPDNRIQEPILLRVGTR